MPDDGFGVREGLRPAVEPASHEDMAAQIARLTQQVEALQGEPRHEVPKQSSALGVLAAIIMVGAFAFPAAIFAWLGYHVYSGVCDLCGGNLFSMQCIDKVMYAAGGMICGAVLLFARADRHLTGSLSNPNSPFGAAMRSTGFAPPAPPSPSVDDKPAIW